MGRELDVLVYGAAERARGIVEQLDRLAFRARVIREDTPPARKSRFYAAEIIFAHDADTVTQAHAALESFAPGHRPVIVVGPSEIAGLAGVDAWIPEPALPAQIAARARALFRLSTMELVAQRRAHVTALYGERHTAAERTESKSSVLYVGDASPRFMSLQHAMDETGAEVVAAFSSYSAFDYLHERSFDAVVLNASGKRDTAFTISSAMRRNARLYHTPVLLLSDDDDLEAAEEAFARGVSDILPPDTTDDEMRDRVLALAAERRRRRQAKAALEACRDPRTLDIETGLFHPGFLTSHLQDLLVGFERDELGFSLLVLRTEVPEEAHQPDLASTEKARRQFAAMLRHLLRSEDAAARIDEDHFVAVLPLTEAEGVDCVAARVSAIAECTAFESEDPLQPFRLAVRATGITPRPGETAEAMLERGLRALQLRPVLRAQA
ncbi:hypothetical protein [Maricaulis sp.]|uniref:GGDEF domain-containing response regulator n=1 Tax=Maricaulis sp. TaxID=1486257 RepID=UPI00262923C4|nr:hypothetical protein [Maricaulis sp.]